MSEIDASSDPSVPTHRRWLVLGAAGAGKTRFATELAEILGLPLIHLDSHYWRPGWVESPRQEWRAEVADLCSGEEWVIDGNYSNSLNVRLPRADVAVLLDIPTWQCVVGIVARGFRHRGRVRPDLAEGCEEHLPDLQFLWWVVSYKWRSRPRVLGRIREAQHVRLYRFRSRRRASAFLAGLRNRSA
jgi:adenylate kinase family enzyme